MSSVWRYCSGRRATLYGRHAVGAKINVISRVPTDDFAAMGVVTLGDYCWRRLSDYVAARSSWRARC